jgi:hypothetical protein
MAQVVRAAQVQTDQVASPGGLPDRAQAGAGQHQQPVPVFGLCVGEELAELLGRDHSELVPVTRNIRTAYAGDQPVEVMDTISHGEVVSYRFEIEV